MNRKQPAVATNPELISGESQQEIRDELQRIRGDVDQAALNMHMKRSVKYTSLESGKEVELTMGLIRSVVSIATKNGAQPNEQDCYKFMKLCEQRQLNPLVGDAYLVGYDQRVAGGGTKPVFSMIVAHSALLKRAEMNQHFKSMTSGVIVVVTKDHKMQIDGEKIDFIAGEIVELPGDFFLNGFHELVGGWAKIVRSDREQPIYDRVNLEVFNTTMSRWAKDPGGMICKVAEASVLRIGFPGETAGLYISEEMENAMNKQLAPKGRSFEVQEIDDAKDRLKDAESVEPDQKPPKSTKKPKTSKKKKADAKKADTEPSNSPPNEQTDEPAVDAEPEAETPSQGESRTPEQESTVESTVDQPENDGDVDHAGHFASIVAPVGGIRKVRSMRDSYISENKLTGEDAESVIEVAVAREKAIRESMA